MIINIKGQDVRLKYGMRAMLAYEEAKPELGFKSDLAALITLIYCIISTSAPNLGLSFDEFMDWIDEDPNFDIMKDWIVSVNLQKKELKRVPDADDGQGSADGQKKN